MLKELTVAKRLILGFGAVVVLGAGTALYAAGAMYTLDGDIKELTGDRLAKIVKLNELRGNLDATARYARNIIINHADAAFVAEETRKRVALRTRNDEIVAELEKTIIRPRGRELLKVLTEARPPYSAALERAVEKAIANDGPGANAILFGEARTLQNVVFKAVADSIDQQQEVADQIARKSTETARFGLVLMSALTLLMAAVGTVVGWLLVRSIRGALGAEPGQLSIAVARVADGDLSRSLSVAPGDRTSVLANIARMQTRLTGVVTEVRSNSQSVAIASAEISQGNDDLSARTEQQASALEQTAASMEELSSTVRQNADNARHANQLAGDASTVAADGGAVVAEVVQTMHGIAESSQRIGDIIGTIDGIAFQTNILALNAAVEAARAGEQGRGFAVVASEVRSLAQRSAEAAKEIKTLIGDSVTRVEQGMALVDKAGTTMTEVVNSIRRVTDVMGEISAASNEQSQGVAQVGQAVMQMDQVTQHNAALVEESAAAAGSLKDQAEQLVQAVAFFQLAGTSPVPAGLVAPVPRSVDAAIPRGTRMQPVKARPA
jgi:methyl-accepting chemotaxis protein